MRLEEIVESNKEKMYETLQELLRIPSVEGEPEEGAPHGKEVQEALAYMLDKAEEMGFSVCDFDHQVGYCEYGKGEQIAVVVHLDVVPAGEGWTRDPFGGEADDTFIYGRGAVDDKGPAVAALYALYAIKKFNQKLKRRIRILFGTNEETGSHDMAYFFSHGGEEPVMGFTPDGTYPLVHGEKGIVISTMRKNYSQGDNFPRLIKIQGGTAFNVVPANAFAEIICDDSIYEKLQGISDSEIKVSRVNGTVRIEAFGESAHGSTPEKGRNAIGLLLSVLKEVPFDPLLSSAIGFLSDKIGLETDGNSLGINLSDEPSGALTLNLGTICGDETHMETGINYRYPVTCSLEDCAPAFNAAFKEHGFTLVSQIHEPALYVDPQSSFVKTLLDVYREHTGDDSGPICIGGGTYAKSVKNTVAFGPTFPEDPDREHKPDECIEKANLLQNAKILADAMYRLAR